MKHNFLLGKVFFLILLSFPITFFLVSGLEVGDSNIKGVVIEQPAEIKFDNNTASVNNSACWLGICAFSDLLHSNLGNLAWSVAGHTIDTDLDLNGNAITSNTGTISFDNENITTTGNITADVVTTNIGI